MRNRTLAATAAGVATALGVLFGVQSFLHFFLDVPPGDLGPYRVAANLAVFACSPGLAVAVGYLGGRHRPVERQYASLTAALFAGGAVGFPLGYGLVLAALPSTVEFVAPWLEQIASVLVFDLRHATEFALAGLAGAAVARFRTAGRGGRTTWSEATAGR